MVSQIFCSSPRAIDPVPQKRLTLDMLKRALAVLTKRNEGGAGTEAAPPPEPLAMGGPCVSDPLGQMIDPSTIDPVEPSDPFDRLDASIYEILTGRPANPIAYDPSGKDWDGIKAAAARGDYVAPPVHIPTTHSSAVQERAVPPLHGALTTWTDKTSRPSLWGRGD